jgi:predicted O-linked N-acetylglucosamine transferase (SPINDLY family)
MRVGDLDAAEQAWKEALAGSPGNAEAMFYLGSIARLRHQTDEAIRLLVLARDAAPVHAGILLNLGLALEEAGRLTEAEANFRSALELSSGAFEPLANLAQNLYRRGRHAEALPLFDALVGRFDVPHASVWANRGAAAFHTHDLAKAEASTRQAIVLDATSATLHADLGTVLLEGKRYEDAARSFEQALRLMPDHPTAKADLLYCRQCVADWHDFDAMAAEVLDAASAGRGRLSPFHCMTICDDPVLQRRVAEAMAGTRAESDKFIAPARPMAGARLRLGFVSYDLYNHPVGRLVVELVEGLDSRRLAVTLYALGEPHDDPIVQRLSAASRYVAIGPLDASALAQRIRDDGIDILFDLNGYTGRSVVDVFAHRPASMQVNYLGYTGTMGATFYDIIVCDGATIGTKDERYYAEAALRIGSCYLPSDTRREVSCEPLALDLLGLPDQSFVLAAFAPLYKILPSTFRAWMTLLRRHPNVVLWLRDGGAMANGRLRASAGEAGVDGSRLIFAPMLDTPRYLARLAHVDLLLDTWPFGGHTTVNDALFMGAPVVTLRGRSFASRASASQVAAAGLGDLVARDADEYVRIASDCIDAPMRLADVKARARAARQRSPLFDARRYADCFTAAIERAWRERSR